MKKNWILREFLQKKDYNLNNPKSPNLKWIRNILQQTLMLIIIKN